MEPIDLDSFKSILEQQLEMLLQNAKGAVADIRRQDSFYPDPADRASYDEERSRILRFRDRESTLIKKINLALERIEDQTYGLCETCGEDIGVKRLYARPVTTKCIQCKTKEEYLEKAVGL